MSNKLKLPFSWYLKMAWKDSRKNPGKLLLYISSIVLGIAAIVAINTFIENVNNDINSEAKELLGADILVRNTQIPDDSTKIYLNSIHQIHAEEIKFSSMMQVQKTGDTRFVSITASDGVYPFYGAIETEPKNAVNNYQKSSGILLDPTLFIQYNLNIGDSIKLGKQMFVISGKILKMPGQTGFSSAVAPKIIIPLKMLSSTGLITYGSRLAYYKYYQTKNDIAAQKLEEDLKLYLAETSYRVESFSKRQERVGDAFSDAGEFLNLVGFIALLLGSIGIASTVSVYLKSKTKDIAVLSCLGISAKKGFRVYLIQVITFGFLGSIPGVILGSAIAYFMPVVLQDFLPVTVNYQISPTAIITGLLLGLTVSIVFTLKTLFKLTATSPLMAINSSVSNLKMNALQVVISNSAIVLFIALFAFSQIKDITQTAIFILACALSIASLFSVAVFLRWLSRKMLRTKWSFPLKQAVLNLYRPGNQTVSLMATIGLGTALIATLFFTQSMLLSKVSFQSTDKDPNMLLFDIQNSQIEDATAFTKQNKLPIISTVPIVTMRLSSLKGHGKSYYTNQNEGLEKEEQVRDNLFNREWRVSFRDSLNDNESIVDGNWIRNYNGKGAIPISVESRNLDNMQAKVGDSLTFNVQGTLLNCYVANKRNVDFNRIETNFSIVFPKGVLEQAPQTHVIITRAANAEKSAIFQRDFIKKFPTVSIVDLNLIIGTVTEIIDKLKFVISFMSLFSIITGFVVLIGSLNSSKNQRAKELVLLKTLGASKKTINKISLFEYLILGLLAALSGILIALVASYGLSIYTFNTIFIPQFLPIIIILIIISLSVLLIGYLNTRKLLQQTPLEILRNEQ